MTERIELAVETANAGPRVLPFNWSPVRDGPPGLKAYRGRAGLLVCLNVMWERDGLRWLHVSMSRNSELPSYDDLRAVKDLFIGRDEEALQIFPPEAEYVNVHPFCLHLWHCIDQRVTPDFREDGMI